MFEFLNRPVPRFVHIAAIAGLIIAALLLIAAQFVPVEQPDPEPELRRLQLELARTNEILDLSIEFGFDPLIVTVTRQLAGKVYAEKACSCATWRFVRSDKDLTYLLLSIIALESGGDYKAFNPGGPAYGLTQMVMSTARAYKKDVTVNQLFTIPLHLDMAMNHFVDLLERYNGNHILAIIAWNRGAGAVDRSIALGEPVDQTRYAHLLFTQATIRNAN